MDWFIILLPLIFGACFAGMALAPPRPGAGTGEDGYTKASRLAHGPDGNMRSNPSAGLAIFFLGLGAIVTIILAIKAIASGF